MSPFRWRRQVSRNTSGLARGDPALLCGLLRTAPIKSQEHFLQARLMAGEVHHPGTGQGLHQRLETGTDDAPDSTVIGLDTIDPGRDTDRFQWNLSGKFDLHLTVANIVQLAQPGRPHQSPAADDADPVADVLDLRQNVGGEKNRGAL